MREETEARLRQAGMGAVLLAVLAGVFFLFTLWRWGRFVKTTIQYVVDHLAARSGISTTLLYGIVVIVTIPFFWAVGKYMHGAWYWLRGVGPGLRLYKSIHGIIIVLYVGVFFLAMYWVSRDSLAYKYCAVTPEGIHVFDDRVKDPVYGIQAEPCSFDQIVALRRAKDGTTVGPQRLAIADPRTYPFFDSVSHTPRVWYSRSPDDSYSFFDRPGFDPVTGAPLLPIDEATLEAIIRAQDQLAAQSAEAKKQQEQADQKRARDAVAARYINTAVTRRPGSKQAAVLLFSSDAHTFTALQSTLDAALSERGLHPVDSFFTPAFVAEGRAARLLAGDWSQAADLGLGDRIDVVILGKASVNATASSDFAGLITTNLTVELSCLNPARQSVCGSRTITAIGAGYSKEASLENASGKAQPEIHAFAEALHVE
jgi:hypothetical protein